MGQNKKFLTRLNDDPNLTKQVAVTLPRLGFEIGSLSYDPSRKLNRVQQFKKQKELIQKNRYSIYACTL